MKKIIERILLLKERYFPDSKFRKTRIWSNLELKKNAHFLDGDIINVSGWQDSDKRGGCYKDYFTNAKSYTISNYSGDSGFQGNPGEIFIDLEKDLSSENIGKFDVVFNHTTLEHVFEVKKAFENLCLLSRDIVIIVVPFLQEMHFGESFKDYWRFTPFAIKRMFEDNKMNLIYLNANNNSKNSVYLFAIGSRYPQKWINKIDYINNDSFNNLGNKIIK